MKTFEVRSASAVDLKTCIGVIREAFDTVALEFALTKENCPTNPAFIELVHLQVDYDKGNAMYVLESGKKITGFMQLEKCSKKEYKLKNLAIVPGCRHMGHGRAMLDFAKAKVMQLGGEVIKIGIIEQNTVLKEWYKKNGFVHTGTKHYEHLPFTVGFMQLDIGKKNC